MSLAYDERDDPDGIGADAMYDAQRDRIHSVYVQTIQSGEGGFFAVCRRCGCGPFPNRRTLAEAERDAQEHGELRHIYPGFGRDA